MKNKLRCFIGIHRYKLLSIAVDHDQVENFFTIFFICENCLKKTVIECWGTLANELTINIENPD